MYHLAATTLQLNNLLVNTNTLTTGWWTDTTVSGDVMPHRVAPTSTACMSTHKIAVVGQLWPKDDTKTISRPTRSREVERYSQMSGECHRQQAATLKMKRSRHHHEQLERIEMSPSNGVLGSKIIEFRMSFNILMEVSRQKTMRWHECAGNGSEYRRFYTWMEKSKCKCDYKDRCNITKNLTNDVARQAQRSMKTCFSCSSFFLFPLRLRVTIVWASIRLVDNLRRYVAAHIWRIPDGAIYAFHTSASEEQNRSQHWR